MKLKEDLDKEYNTCRYCEITTEKIEELKKQTGEYQSNYVMSGCCRVCRDKRKDESDFEEAKKNGEITRDDSIMCPYCGDIVEDDLYELHNRDEYHCSECNKKSKIEVESTFHYTTTKIVEER